MTYVGELGWELYIPSEFAQDLYDRLLEAGKEMGLKHAGMHALNSLRLEKAYRHWGMTSRTRTLLLKQACLSPLPGINQEDS